MGELWRHFVGRSAVSITLLNFSPKIKKTRIIIYSWLQRDLSIYGRVLISKAEGLSCCVYPALSLFISDKIADDINKILLNFIWKNKSHKIRKSVFSNRRSEGGLEVLDFKELVRSFKISWLKKCLCNNSIWYYIPKTIFRRLGGLDFLLKCSFTPSKLPISLE